MINVYLNKSKARQGVPLRFIHMSTSKLHGGRDEIFNGILVDEYTHTQRVNMNPSKMISRGWLKAPEPMLTLKEQMLADVTNLNRATASGSHVLPIAAVTEMIGKYAELLQLSESANVFETGPSQ